MFKSILHQFIKNNLRLFILLLYLNPAFIINLNFKRSMVIGYPLPDGASVSTVKGRVQAVGVALLFVYSLNFICQGIITFVMSSKSEDQKKPALKKLLQTSRILYLFGVATIFSIYPPFYQGTHSAVLAWITFVLVILLHIFSFFHTTIGVRSVWSFVYMAYHIMISIWFIIALGYAYNWSTGY